MADVQCDGAYPVFTDPEAYMRRRAKSTPMGLLKSWTEAHALRRCLSGATNVRTVCDVPCGPGRLFPFWQRLGARVHGFDISAPMVKAAENARRENHLSGSVRSGDAFDLGRGSCPTWDVVASVRFLYYFERERRIALLRSFAAASRRYVLVQYKTAETLKGRINQIRRERKNGADGGEGGKHFCSYDQITEEVAESGLTLLKIAPIGELSDRVFVLAEKPGRRLHRDPGLHVWRDRRLIPRRMPFSSAVTAMVGAVLSMI